MTAAFLPPSSKDSFLQKGAETALIRVPTSVLPVKDISGTSGCLTIACQSPMLRYDDPYHKQRQKLQKRIWEAFSAIGVPWLIRGGHQKIRRVTIKFWKYETKLTIAFKHRNRAAILRREGFRKDCPIWISQEALVFEYWKQNCIFFDCFVNTIEKKQMLVTGNLILFKKYTIQISKSIAEYPQAELLNLISKVTEPSVILAKSASKTGITNSNAKFNDLNEIV